MSLKELIKEVEKIHKTRYGYYIECGKKKGFNCNVCDFIKSLEKSI